jgi:hypothetical protein
MRRQRRLKAIQAAAKRAGVSASRLARQAVLVAIRQRRERA